MTFLPQYGDAGIKPLRNQWRGDTENATLELDSQLVLEIVEDITKGLNYIHAGGVVHRDLKPRNGIYFVSPDLS